MNSKPSRPYFTFTRAKAAIAQDFSRRLKLPYLAAVREADEKHRTETSDVVQREEIANLLAKIVGTTAMSEWESYMIYTYKSKFSRHWGRNPEMDSPTSVNGVVTRQSHGKTPHIHVSLTFNHLNPSQAATLLEAFKALVPAPKQVTREAALQLLLDEKMISESTPQDEIDRLVESMIHG